MVNLLWVTREDDDWHGARELFRRFIAEAAKEVAQYRKHSGDLVESGPVLLALSADRRPIGALGVTESHDCSHPVLAWIYVDTEHRKVGVGRALVERLVERFGSEIGFDGDPPPTDAGKAMMAACPTVTWRDYTNTNLVEQTRWRAKRNRDRLTAQRRKDEPD